MELETKAENPLVSIVVPLFNHEKYIKKTLESIKTDTYANKEIIVINDGSKDNSELEVLNWKEKNESILIYNIFIEKIKEYVKL
ncbi:MAG: glycosyltransferase family A protein [Sediminibacterium sp.]|nr:glycosyltransferase family A protein [Sediminibacterium sp.]